MHPDPTNTPKKPDLLKTRWFWSLLIVIVIILGSAWILFSRAGSSGEDIAGSKPAPVAGHPAPDFELKSLDGEAVRLSNFAGTPVLLNFWATWCGPCRAEFPDFQKAYLENGDKLVIIGVNHTTLDQAEQVDDFVAEMGATFPIVLDKTGQTAETFQIRALPTSIFIDRNGIINEVFTGPINKAYIEAKLDEL